MRSPVSRLLFFLPVMFMALYGTRRTPGVAIFGTVLAMALPILLVGAPQYPVGEWRRTLIWVAVAPMIGVVVQDLVMRLRQHQEAIARVTTAARGIAHEGDNREATCRGRGAGRPLQHARHAGGVRPPHRAVGRGGGTHGGPGRADRRAAGHRPGEPRGQTASVGAATFVPGAPLATLVEQADQALYRAKSNGRDSRELVPASV